MTGPTIGPNQILDKLGAGGRCPPLRPGRRDLLESWPESGGERFEGEAQVLASLNRPNIAAASIGTPVNLRKTGAGWALAVE